MDLLASMSPTSNVALAPKFTRMRCVEVHLDLLITLRAVYALARANMFENSGREKAPTFHEFQPNLNANPNIYSVMKIFQH